MTDKQIRFIEEYCVDFNATQAAIRAGYSEDTARQIGYENLTKLDIKQAVDKRLNELSMSAAEATKRLTDWGRSSFDPFVKQDQEHGIVLDLGTENARKHIHLIKKIKQTRTVKRIGENLEIDYTTEIELHDAKDAVDKIAKIRGLYKDENENSNVININFPENFKNL